MVLAASLFPPGFDLALEGLDVRLERVDVGDRRLTGQPIGHRCVETVAPAVAVEDYQDRTAEGVVLLQCAPTLCSVLLRRRDLTASGVMPRMAAASTTVTRWSVG